MFAPMMNLRVWVEGKPARKTLELEGCWCEPLGIQHGGCLERCCVSQAELEHTSNYTAQLDNRLGMAEAGADNVSGSCAGMQAMA